MFCKECGRNIDDNNLCPYCNVIQVNSLNDFEFVDFSEFKFDIRSEKSFVIAGFLQIFLGVFGIGRFYLGYNSRAVAQIIASVLSLGTVGFFWGLIDGIRILNGDVKFDAAGKLL